MILHIGVDDTDSPKGGCTTYIAALIIESLSKLNVNFLDYPTLLRLNPNTPWTQCEIVNAELGRNDCCSTPLPVGCNLQHPLGATLKRTGNLVGNPIASSVPMDDVAEEIRNGHPICVRVEWTTINNMGHFLAIIGYNIILDQLLVADPLFGESQSVFSAFETNYLNKGTWTHSYKVQP